MGLAKVSSDAHSYMSCVVVKVLSSMRIDNIFEVCASLRREWPLSLEGMGSGYIHLQICRMDMPNIGLYMPENFE